FLTFLDFVTWFMYSQLIFFCFFILLSGVHLDLHSFPTRRSSDLAAPRVGSAVCIQVRAPATITPAVRNSPNPTRLRSAALNKGLDRKSTRLNSSHRTISYAVFCLKKKKKTLPITYFFVCL